MDDSKKTFEVCGQSENNNSFTNNVHGMQKAGMNISCITPPVTNKIPNKDAVKITNYTKETGLHERLLNEYKAIMRRAMDQW
jgi:hypothetical protein